MKVQASSGSSIAYRYKLMIYKREVVHFAIQNKFSWRHLGHCLRLVRSLMAVYKLSKPIKYNNGLWLSEWNYSSMALVRSWSCTKIKTWRRERVIHDMLSLEVQSSPLGRLFNSLDSGYCPNTDACALRYLKYIKIMLMRYFGSDERKWTNPRLLL